MTTGWDGRNVKGQACTTQQSTGVWQNAGLWIELILGMMVDKDSNLTHALVGGGVIAGRPGRIADSCRDGQCISVNTGNQIRHIGSLGDTVGRLARLGRVGECLHIVIEDRFFKVVTILVKPCSQFKTHAGCT